MKTEKVKLMCTHIHTHKYKQYKNTARMRIGCCYCCLWHWFSPLLFAMGPQSRLGYTNIKNTHVPTHIHIHNQ